MAKVSVIVPVHNGAATVGRALESIFAQTFSDCEIIVVDDGSTDASASVLAGYGDRILVVRLRNGGASVARNAGVRASSGEYLAFLDDDDEWMAQKLERSVPILDHDPDCALVYTLALKVDLQGRSIGSLAGQTDGLESPTMAQMLDRPWNVVPSQFMVRREVFDRCGGFYGPGCEDRFFLLQAREHGTFRCVRETLLRRTIRPLYPTMLKREPRFTFFLALVRERYGASAEGLIRGMRHSRAELMKHMARVLMKEGRPEDARRCLARVIYYEPASPRAYRKFLQTFLPARAPRTTAHTGDGKA
jgi:glycosyltransferase involved in cell wall biosynthesis